MRLSKIYRQPPTVRRLSFLDSFVRKTGCRMIAMVVIIPLVSLACNRSSNTDPGWSSGSLQMPGTYTSSKLPEINSDGAKLVSEYCAQCHAVPSPSAHSASDWVAVFRRMMLLMEKSGHNRGRMGGMMGRNNPMGMMGARVPSRDEQKIMLGYLQAHALKSIPKENLPNPGSAGATAFDLQCARCHALPDPGQHTPGQWPAVVSRMQKHAEEAKLPPITEKDVTLILKYLQQHAGSRSE